MKWSPDAEAAIKKVPFFIRKKVIKKVEAHVQEQGRARVEMEDVTSLKKKFLSQGGMEKQMQGYDISTCFGSEGCPHRAADSRMLFADIQTVMKEADLFSFLKTQVRGDLKFHHEFRVSLSDCPNACSRPQIVDVGIIGAQVPLVGGKACTLCNECVEICPEQVITLGDAFPVIDETACLACGKCIIACPTGTITTEKTGFRVMLGGRLGRHPRLALEVPGIFSHDQVLAILKNSLLFYKTHSKNGQRFSQILNFIEQVLPMPSDIK